MAYGIKMLQILRKGLKELKEINDETFKTGLYLHDIGKIDIDKRILYKPGKLTDWEYSQIKRHTETGVLRLIQAINYDSEHNQHNICIHNIPKREINIIKDMILYHHERIDGQGYYGLVGNQIPIQARICQIADTYDTITSSRSYKRAKTKKEAFLILDSVKGTQLDERLVQLLLKEISWAS